MSSVPEKPALDGIESRWIAKWDADGTYSFDRGAVRADVFGATGYPQILMRVGWAPVDADPLPATPRLPLREVADWNGLSAVGN